MNWLDSTLADFVRGMGLPAASFSQTPTFVFRYEHRGTLFLESTEMGVRVSLARQLEHATGKHFAKALSLCSPAETRDRTIFAGITGDDLVFVTHIREQEFVMPTLDRVLETLVRMHDRVAEAK